MEENEFPLLILIHSVSNFTQFKYHVLLTKIVEKCINFIVSYLTIFDG
jgi:hypothetical protein